MESQTPTMYCSFCTLFITIISSVPSLVLEQTRKFHDAIWIEIAQAVKLQIIIFAVLKIRQVAINKILHLRPQMTKPQIQTLLQDNNLDVCVNG